MAKEYAQAFYHSGEWKAMRQIVLKRDRYCCVRCGAPGTEVHHIIHLNKDNINDPKISLNPKNLELLCDYCHKREHDPDRHEQTAEMKAKQSIKLDYEFDSEGNILPRERVGQN